MISKDDLYQAIKTQCELSFENIAIDKSLSKMCEFCGSDLIEYISGIYPKLRTKCHHCEKELDFYQAFGISHSDIRQGVEDFFEDCEECGEHSMFGNICTNSECNYEYEPIIDPDTGCVLDEDEIRKIQEKIEKD
ncbi:hypothetical protein ACWA5Z_05330 [Testudinibacter sp. P80/BLE/0925]|uniref:hypothetical protein n=1 Tax=Testudinibacter sp. TW-1 TaxID=3417757 RepID=UPI003D35B55B